MLKALSLLVIRIGTGALLIVWGAMRLMDPATGPGLSEKYYGGIGALSTLQTIFAAAEVVVGLLVVLGLFRKFVFPLQALVLVGGALAIWKHLLDPLGLWLQESSNVLFFPSLTVAGATLVLIAFRKDDRFSLDRTLGRR